MKRPTTYRIKCTANVEMEERFGKESRGFREANASAMCGNEAQVLGEGIEKVARYLEAWAASLAPKHENKANAGLTDYAQTPHIQMHSPRSHTAS